MRFRIDRFISLCLFNLLDKANGSKPNYKIPILMYHSISSKIEREHPYYQINTSPNVFKMHLQYLKDFDYQVIDLEKAVSLIDSSQPINAKNVVITFDDGYQDFNSEASLLLKSYGFTATVFLPSAYITEEGSMFNGKPCLRWNEVRKLAQDGISFGSHTVTHPKLSVMNKHKIENEIKLSKERIEDKTGLSVDRFSYPYAFPDHQRGYSQYLCEVLEKCGYKTGVTTRIGRASKNDLPFMLKRLPVNSHDDLKLFEMKLKGAYDLLYLPQYGFKIIKSALRRSKSKCR